MKFKNIEDVWAYAKNKLVNAQISSIQRTGSSKFFDLTVPKSMIKKFPEGSRNRDLEYTITETAGEIECFLENTSDVTTIVDTRDFFDAISVWCGINESLNEAVEYTYEVFDKNASKPILTGTYKECVAYVVNSKDKLFMIPSLDALKKCKYSSSFMNDRSEINILSRGYIKIAADKWECHLPQASALGGTYNSQQVYNFLKEAIRKNSKYTYLLEGQQMNQNAIIGIESTSETGYDKVITFSYYTSRADLEKQFKKLGKPYMLNVYPGDEAQVFVKNSDVDKFKGLISALTEKIDTTMNMIMMEGITIKGRPVPEKLKGDFSSQEISFINSVIGNTWYQITPKSKVFKDVNTLSGKSRKDSEKFIDGVKYTIYEAPKGTKFLLMDMGMGSEAFLFGSPKINESEEGDKYREFFENKLKQWNISSPAELTQQDRSKFFTEIRDEWKKQKVNESFEQNGYTILDQAEFRAEFGGDNNLASYALYSLYNTRLVVKCTPENPKYYKIKAKVESMPEITEMDKGDIHVYRQTASNLIIIYNNNIYWAYNTGTNLQLLNEAELVKGIGRVFDTLSDRGEMSNNAVVAAIKALGDTMSSLSVNPTTNSIKAYKVAEDEYQCLIGELEKRGLRPSNR